MKGKGMELNGKKKEILAGGESIVVEAKYWSSYGKERLYFSLPNKLGQACWDCQIKEFIKCRSRVGAKIEGRIREAFDL